MLFICFGEARSSSRQNAKENGGEWIKIIACYRKLCKSQKKKVNKKNVLF